ncbi:DUF2779 domain-containing protein [Mangrovimonas sp. DI 80]|uniref:DUF2779 domain-containing protein n=1 Tax=Mangrovimonas sp. DI 80 TaxID=1779330 RepID=UPI0009763093|nr:DUF2779 domain-containing protein [Mangrovimonas sp. DI 80]OMP32267.1 hypothetical protein BKM32_04235 [Mangrovimonas sp. DI 80]
MTTTNQRYLTKSRFKLALDCPTKLFYTRKPEYENQSESDPFLEALAEGGFQVEELARMYYPEGIAILGEDWNYELLAQRTAALLQQENVVIFEAAFLYEGLFIRVDILEKKGDKVQLIEVKAKSINGLTHDSFFGARGGLNSGWTAYLYDIAFQNYVIQKAYPEWQISPYLKLVNKDAVASVDGINQCFKISKNSDLRTGITKKEGLTLEDLGSPLLANIPVQNEIDLILGSNPLFEGLTFEDTVTHFMDHYQKDLKINQPIGHHCKGCEFYTETPTDTHKSGFHECWTSQTQLRPSQVTQPKVYDVWNFRSSKKIMEGGTLFMEDLQESDVNLNLEAGKISNSERQWIQIVKTQELNKDPYFELDGLRKEMATWVYPLNFIDFETSMVALPFTKGRHPYEQTAFQFSHHLVYEDGRVEHKTEYLNAQVGVFPNFDFVRALKAALETNGGSIFRYHIHENTVLNQIYLQLEESDEADKEALQGFIRDITYTTGSNPNSWCGDRDMIDLYQVVKNFYYDPATQGSISIKAVLPAVLNSSDFLKSKYSQPLSDIEVSSKNFSNDHVFITLENGEVKSPYKTLAPLFDNWTDEDLENLVSDMGMIADGGAALTAYSKLQFETMMDLEREAISKGLLKYCEIDTLAMVMIYEYFLSISSEPFIN